MRFFLFLPILAFFITVKAQDTTSTPIFSLQQYQNRILQKNDTLYVVNFWATWCKPCVMELPYFEAVRQDMKDQPVKFILVSQDMKTAGKKVSQFLAKNNYGSEVFILSAGNPNIWIDLIEPTWTGTIPATLLYKNGQKLKFQEGEFADKTELEHFIHQK